MNLSPAISTIMHITVPPFMVDPDKTAPSCAQDPTDDWFTTSPLVARNLAATYCADCPHLMACREHGLANETSGIWGGVLLHGTYTTRPRHDLLAGGNMARSRATARKAGTAWETAIVRTLRDHGWPHAERRARTGAHDQGDVTGIPGVCIEAKNTNRTTLAEWVDQTTTETANANATIGAAWVKRRGKTNPTHGYVVMTGATFMRLLAEAGYR